MAKQKSNMLLTHTKNTCFCRNIHTQAYKGMHMTHITQTWLDDISYISQILNENKFQSSNNIRLRKHLKQFRFIFNFLFDTECKLNYSKRSKIKVPCFKRWSWTALFKKIARTSEVRLDTQFFGSKEIFIFIFRPSWNWGWMTTQTNSITHFIIHLYFS